MDSAPLLRSYGKKDSAIYIIYFSKKMHFFPESEGGHDEMIRESSMSQSTSAAALTIACCAWSWFILDLSCHHNEQQSQHNVHRNQFIHIPFFCSFTVWVLVFTYSLQFSVLSGFPDLTTVTTSFSIAVASCSIRLLMTAVNRYKSALLTCQLIFRAAVIGPCPHQNMMWFVRKFELDRNMIGVE